MSALSKMDKGAPEVGESLSFLEELILVPPPIAPDSPVLSDKVGVMRQLSGH